MSAPVIVPSRSVKFWQTAARPTGRSGPDGQMGQRGRDGEPGQPDEKVPGPLVLQGQWRPRSSRSRRERGDRATLENRSARSKGTERRTWTPAPTSRSAPGAPGRQGEQGRRENADQKVQKENPVHQERQVNLDYKAERVLLDSPVLTATMPFVTTVSRRFDIFLFQKL